MRLPIKLRIEIDAQKRVDQEQGIGSPRVFSKKWLRRKDNRRFLIFWLAKMVNADLAGEMDSPRLPRRRQRRSSARLMTDTIKRFVSTINSNIVSVHKYVNRKRKTNFD